MALAESSSFMGDVCSKTVSSTPANLTTGNGKNTFLSSPKHSAATQPGCAAAVDGLLIESCSFTQF